MKMIQSSLALAISKQLPLYIRQYLQFTRKFLNQLLSILMLTHLTDSEDKVYALSLGTDKLSEYPIVNVPAMLTLPNLYEENLPLAVGCILLVVTASRNLLVLTAQPLLPSLAKRLQLAAIVRAL